MEGRTRMNIFGTNSKEQTKTKILNKPAEVKKSTFPKRKSNPAITIAAVKQIHDGSVAARAIKRAGKNKNLKGHIFEILTRDQYNLNPKNIAQGREAVLTKSPTAMRDDIVIKQGKKIVGRMQLKDTPKGINDTVKKVASGQYKGTKLVGTKETKKVYDATVATKNAHGANITQKMSTNGISSADTELIQAKALGGSVLKNGRAIAGQTAKTGVTSAVISGGIATVSNVKKVVRGEKTKTEAAVAVAKEAGTGAVSGMAANVAGTAATIAVAGTPLAPAAPAAGVAASMAAGYVADVGCRKVDQYMQNREKRLKQTVETNKRVAIKYKPVLGS